MQKLIEEYNYLNLKDVNGFKVYNFNTKKQGGPVVNNVLKNLTGLNLKNANIERIEKIAQKKGLYIRLAYKYHTINRCFGYDLLSVEEEYNKKYKDITFLLVNKTINRLDPYQFDNDKAALKALDKLFDQEYRTLYRVKLGKWIDFKTFKVEKEVFGLTFKEAKDWKE